jgi:uncharacterized protein
MVGTPVERLDEDSAWELLRTATLGRLAVVAYDGVDLFPINFTVFHRAIYFRSAPGSKLIDLAANPGVAFESDGISERLRWSVVVRGTARRLDSDTEIIESGIHTLKTAEPSDKWNYVRITPDTISGRRFRAH